MSEEKLTDTSATNKRIAKNSLMLYIRMILVLGISLYTSRVILDVLGVLDFGIYNVIAGVTSMLLFFTSSLSNASQRYISFEIGAKNYEEANKVFNISIELYSIIGILLLIVFETLGLWLVNYKLIIPSDRLVAANFVYQFTVLTALISILQVPYQSTIIAEERMGIYAYMGIYNALMKLLIIYLLSLAHDKLILYGLLFMLVELSCSIFYIIYCRAKFTECRIKYFWNTKKVIEIFTFISYTAYGCISWSLAYQGATILLNIFFGPVVNAARGIAMQINASINNFSSAIITAIKPQIIKSYACGDYNYMRRLIIFSSKYTLLLFLLLSIPLMYNIDFVLSKWLTEVPLYTNTFACLIIIDSIIASLLQPIGIALNAIGKIKNIQVYGRTITLMALPVSYIIYKLNLFSSPNAIFIVLIVAEIGYLLYSFNDMHKQLKFGYALYSSKVITPILIVAVIATFSIYVLKLLPISGWISFFISCIYLDVVIVCSSFIFVMTKSERSLLLNFIKVRFTRHALLKE